MRRFWLSKDHFQDTKFLLEGEKFKHICGVCRMGLGSKFEILTPDGNAYFCELTDLEKKSATATILEKRKVEPLASPYIHLFISLPKIPKLEFILEKAVELGVKEVTPVLSDFSFVKKPQILLDKNKRFQKIIESATQQSARADLMPINNAISLEEMVQLINQNDTFNGLFAYEGESKRGMKKALESPKYSESGSTVALIVGSEGGFSQEEVNYLISHGIEPVSLGTQVLRVETACLALVSAIKYQLGLFDLT
ncbi:MAG: 16S rRNA (uracil(1498)-N(3))-methyltransferase [Bdellovibrionales bacterium]